MRLANIGKNFWKATLSDISEDYDCKRYMLRYADNIIPNMRDAIGLLLHGPKGHGKTHIACALLKQAISHNARCLFLPVNMLQTAVIEKTPLLGFDDEEILFIDRARTCDLLVLDDLGEEHARDFSIRMLENLCRIRSNDALATIFTSNVGHVSKLDDIYGDWVGSLFKEMACPIKVQGIDWRDKCEKKQRRRVRGGE